MTLALIYARSENFCIGADGGLPWRLPNEFKHFKRTTMGCPILMGRRTYEDHDNVLPGRTNVVLTRQDDFVAKEGMLIRRDLDEALAEFAPGTEANPGETAFVIGGAGLFAAAFPRADRVYETVVHGEFEGDTFLEPFDFSGWNATVLEEHPADDKHSHAYTATRYDRGG
ncbi:MAG: dihydrofolate reductase [Planctomycetota bacterium]